MSQNKLHDAERIRADYEMANAFIKSPIGHRFKGELKRIENQATKGAMLGKTPQDNNAYMEGRGKYAAVMQIRRFFNDLADENDKAIAAMQNSATQETE